jgi:hypothetical protein
VAEVVWADEYIATAGKEAQDVLAGCVFMTTESEFYPDNRL